MFWNIRDNRSLDAPMSERDQTKLPEIGELPVQPNLTMEPVQEASDIAMDAELQAFIGRQLRAAYDEVLNEPVPDRFRALLEQLDQAEPEARNDGGSAPRHAAGEAQGEDGP
jgi:hypothetical protein